MQLLLRVLNLLSQVQDTLFLLLVGLQGLVHVPTRLRRLDVLRAVRLCQCCITKVFLQPLPLGVQVGQLAVPARGLQVPAQVHQDVQGRIARTLPKDSCEHKRSEHDLHQTGLGHVFHLHHEQDRGRRVALWDALSGVDDILLRGCGRPEVVVAAQDHDGDGIRGPLDRRPRKRHGAAAVDAHGGWRARAEGAPEDRQHHLAAPGACNDAIRSGSNALGDQDRAKALQVWGRRAAIPILRVPIVVLPSASQDLDSKSGVLFHLLVDRPVRLHARAGADHRDQRRLVHDLSEDVRNLLRRDVKVRPGRRHAHRARGDNGAVLFGVILRQHLVDAALRPRALRGAPNLHAIPPPKRRCKGAKRLLCVDVAVGLSARPARRRGDACQGRHGEERPPPLCGIGPRWGWPTG
mmetsp:Transcript_139493/g.446298  ORF Transcript_139493/g.446298 Transcript_139493/m.446298 type:complete len:407 (+) Transcript_139493:1123-2343(+)